MEAKHSNALREQVLGNRALLAELFLVRPLITNEDVVRLGVATTSDAAEEMLESLRASGVIEKKEYGYTCPLEILNWVSELLPPRDDAEKLKRAMSKHFKPSVQESMVRRTLEALSPIATSKHPASRPTWYFDLTAIIHPALSIDQDLNITACSDALCDFLRPVYPDLKAQVDAGNLGLMQFLRGLDLYHFDYETLEPSEVHVLDPTPKFLGLLQHLAESGSVNKKPALVRMGKLQHYLELSFALQVAFPGAQSIWHEVDRRVGQMRLIRAMHFTKWFITAHRLKQPTNLFNIARAKLDVMTRKSKKAQLTQEYVQSKISEVTESLSAGIEEFSRFVAEISGREYQIVTNLEKTEDVDVIAVLEDVVTDIDHIYAKPSGVLIALDIPSSNDTSFFISTSHFLLREALFNIVHNAFKHGRRGTTDPKIHIRCVCSVSRLVIEVEDNGSGMTERELQDYAQAFNEIGPIVSPAESGALSGLSLAMSVIKNSGGNISFKNLKPTGFRTTLVFDAC